MPPTNFDDPETASDDSDLGNRLFLFRVIVRIFLKKTRKSNTVESSVISSTPGPDQSG